jgi:hypothetical protein
MVMLASNSKVLSLISVIYYFHGGFVMLLFLILKHEYGFVDRFDEPTDFRIYYIHLFCYSLFISFAFLQFASGYFISKRSQYRFSFLVACLDCAFIPTGTVLGISTIALLFKESVKNVYLSGKS